MLLRREALDEVSEGCGKELFKVQVMVAQDYRVDPSLFAICKEDAERLCAGVKEGGGRIQACLVSVSGR